MTSVTFAPPTLLVRKRTSKVGRTFKPPHCLPKAPCAKKARIIASLPAEEVQDQWDQHQQRDPKLDEEIELARAIPARQRHTHVFFQTFSSKMFNSAASRFLSSSRANKQAQHRLWLLRAIADPTFGGLRGGEPYPPRCAIVSHLSQDYRADDVRTWVRALDRIGPAVSPMDSHFVDWAVCHTLTTEQDVLPDMSDSFVVAMEVLNANWANARTVSGMRERLIQHADEVTKAGFASSFEVLQSIDSPTCFKTMEVYPSVDHLQQCLDELDEPFATEMMKHRAAVNRVRQLHECVGCL